MDRVDAHVALFNAAVRSNDWPAFIATFAPDAIMGFVGVPAGPFRGRDAIAQAYANQPPDDTMTVHAVTSSGARDRCVSAGTVAGTARWTCSGAEIKSLSCP